MTLAPVIGGSERQGFGKYSLCSEKKEQIERPSRRNPSPNERKIHNDKLAFAPHNTIRRM